MRRENDGDLRVKLSNSFVGDDLKLSESDDGTGTVELNNTTVVDNKEFNNVEEI